MNTKQHVPPKVIEAAGCVFAHPDLKGRRHKNGNVYTSRTLFLYNVAQVLYKNNKWHAKKHKPVSDDTKYKRFTECQSMCHDLHNLGYKVMLPTQIRQKHVKALTHYWEASDLMPGTIAQKVSVLRTLLGWVGRTDVIGTLTNEDMFNDPKCTVRTLVAKEDKSWDKKTDILRLLDQVEADDKFVGRQLKLAHFFGMRVEETMMLRPAVDYDRNSSVLHVRRGTKGGRPRIVLVEKEAQKELLETLIEQSFGKPVSTMPLRAKLGGWLKHFYKVCNRHGISRKDGITPHGLRHGYAHRLYEEKTGSAPTAVTGVKLDIDYINDRIARLLVAEDLGHSRVSISSAYLG